MAAKKSAKKPGVTPRAAGSDAVVAAKPPSAAAESRGGSSFWANNLLMPALAVFTGLVVGGVIIALANDTAIAAWGNFFRNPFFALKASWDAVMQAYGALFAGAL